MNYRAHQSAAIEWGRGIAEGTEPTTSVVAWVVPGGGKSWLPPLVLRELGDDWKLAWFVPRLNLATQAELDTLKKHGLRIRKSGNVEKPARDTRGFVTTHQSLEENPELWAQAMDDGSRWLLVFDELHHAFVNHNDTLSKTARALAGLPYSARLLMTGTLERSDQTQRIYGIEYEMTAKGYRISSDIGIRYDRQTALQRSEGPAIVPVTFEWHDGPVKWDDLKLNREDGCQLSQLAPEDEGIGAFTACQTGIAEKLLHRGLDQWRGDGSGKAIVVCARQVDAKRWANVASEYAQAVVAVSEDEGVAQANIARFREPDGPRILVTVAMAYEGLDVPEITHGICLTHIRSVPWIEQMLARAWRKTAGKDACYWWVPDDPRMNRVIDRIKAEQPAEVITTTESPRDGGPGGQSTRIPLSSTSTHRRVTGLDGNGTYSDIGTVESMLAAFGLEDLIPEARRRLTESKTQEDTPSQQEKRYRAQFWSEIVRVNKEYGIDYPKVGYELNCRAGAKAEVATIEQLRQGIKYARSKWPPLGS